MQLSSDQDLRKLYKRIEDEINRNIFSQTNSLLFIKMTGDAIEEHLNHLVTARELTKQWLDCNGLPTRDDIGDLAKKIIENENRLDRLDDTLYLVLKNIKAYRRQMAGLALDLDGISESFYTEVDRKLAES
ncbi:hypothetical protein QNH20_08190 [Neobacillus sp. WH10]|uniref:hypothetical protein n=1 Tax=Neobacillus sp. WH10 TaxID=3047873 RepID=UPI0024C12541|nr:hypothetical protein [Neobacillus sp. WH10]WHY79095.1 hypothetical protein QNH20_08190 [Neobacillus sp. WH10]